MTRDEIIKLSQEIWWASNWSVTPEALERFAAIVAAAEREECARVASWILKMPQNDVSSSIRARGNK